jgi:hypothetical protein
MNSPALLLPSRTEQDLSSAFSKQEVAARDEGRLSFAGLIERSLSSTSVGRDSAAESIHDGMTEGVNSPGTGSLEPHHDSLATPEKISSAPKGSYDDSEVSSVLNCAGSIKEPARLKEFSNGHHLGGAVPTAQCVAPNAAPFSTSEKNSATGLLCSMVPAAILQRETSWETSRETPSQELSPVRDSNRAPTAPMHFTGIASAQGNITVQTLLEQPKNAPLQEQNLPGALRLPEFSAPSSSVDEEREISSALRSAAVPVLASSHASSLSELKPIGSSMTHEWRAEQVERLADLIARQTVLLRQVGEGSLQAVLNASSSSKLLLQLHTTSQGAEARLYCQPEDFAMLQKHWPQLQESLAQQQIRLLPLKESAGQWSSPMSAESGDSGERRPESGDNVGQFFEPVEPVEDFSASVSPFRPAARWERWA